MKKFIFAILMAASGFAGAYVNPTPADLAAYRTRMQLYVSMNQTPSQVVVSLTNYFGKAYFVTRSNGWTGTTDIQVQQGEGREIVYMETLGTMKAQ